MPGQISFTLESNDLGTKARAGVLTTANAVVQTPVFMPVATHGVVRGQSLDVVDQLGYKMLLTNTYHLLLRPGPDLLRAKGGLRSFVAWPHGFLSDSGGFQLFSLSKSIEISEEGALFTSYIDGRKILLTPELSIAMQGAIGSDIMMVLDQCLPSLSERGAIEKALHLTHRWAKRSFDARGDSTQGLFGIVQGGCFLDLRKLSAELTTEIPFDGFAVGGVAVGDDRSVRDEVIDRTVELLPSGKPRYLMGVGTPSDLLEGVARGIDMFDCILPTALAEHGKAFTYQGRLNLLRGVYAGSDAPISDDCECVTCKQHTRGYLHHLLKAKEHVAHSMIGIHNLTFYDRLMRDMRGSILEGVFSRFYEDRRKQLVINDAEFPSVPPKVGRKRMQQFLGDYEVVIRNDQGSDGQYGTIKHQPSGEVMHSVLSPVAEAKRLYLDQSGIMTRLRAAPEAEVVLWDVGLGAATNVMSVIAAYEQSELSGERLAKLRIISFESSLGSLRLALKNPALFAHIRHPAPHGLLHHKVWNSDSGGIEWSLLHGDFRKLYESAARPEIVFYDPFSINTNPELWTLDLFQGLFEVCAVGEEGAQLARPCQLITYSAATRVRAALIAAGFWVGLGVSTGPKDSTTISYSQRPDDPAAIGRLLPMDWLARWERSDGRYPVLLPDQMRSPVEQRVRSHPQFQTGLRDVV